MIIKGGQLIANINDDGMTTVEGLCTMCKKKITVIADTGGIAEWLGGMVIQKALPGLSDNEREFLIDQVCGNCWDKLFPEEDE